MAILTASEVITQVRTLMLDLNATNQTWSDAQILTRWNEKYLRWFEVIGRRISWLTATALGWSITDGNYSVISTPTDIIEVERVFFEGTDAADALTTNGTPMENVKELDDILRLVIDKPTKGTPSMYRVFRVASAAPANVGKHTLIVHPPSTNTSYFSAMVRRYPSPIDAVTVTTPDVTEADAYTLCRLTAAELAAAMGRGPEFVQDILAPVPDEVRASMGVILRNQQRRPRREQEATS